jgi:signal transduction histidine kinase
VFNEGPEVPPEEIPRLFERFARARPMQTEGLSGSGLGLYMCRRVVEAHGGTIWVENEPGAGPWFRFTLQPSQ